LYIQIQFKSFYKWTNLKLLELDKTVANTTIEKNSYGVDLLKYKDKHITAVNTQLYLFLYILYRYTTQVKTNHIFNNYTVASFVLPTKKKSVIFLRAPYKNKLARLNILNLEYTLIISIRNKKITSQPYNSIITLTETNEFLKNNLFNFSTHRTKHMRTVFAINTQCTSNFLLANFS